MPPTLLEANHKESWSKETRLSFFDFPLRLCDGIDIEIHPYDSNHILI